MLNLLEKIKNKYFQVVPTPIVRGASDMIKKVAQEEELILQLQTQNLKPVRKKTQPKLDMASILSKYVSKDLNNDAYVFIELNPSLNYNEASIQL